MDTYPLLMCPEELYIDPPIINVRISPLQQVEREMFEKYKITDAADFIRRYIEFACNRSAEQTLNGEMLLPPGHIDKTVAYRECHECIDLLNVYSRVCTAKRAEITALGMKASKGNCTLQEKEVLGFKTSAYVARTSKACKARQRLWEISGLIPIDASQFHKDMLWYTRVIISERFAASGYPDLYDLSL